ncbi:MAG: hypothetical protein M1833_004327 [Piccolia ochrophora]|nr:MAG: hypothetical protein M1833_004327 [Piccolia ochrophora]
MNSSAVGKRSSPSTNNRPKNKPNGSILNFFQKVDAPKSSGNGVSSGPSAEDPNSLFFGDEDVSRQAPARERSVTPHDMYIEPVRNGVGRGSNESGSDETRRFNEDTRSIKKRRYDGNEISMNGVHGNGSNALTAHMTTERDSLTHRPTPPGARGRNDDTVRPEGSSLGNGAFSPPPPEDGDHYSPDPPAATRLKDRVVSDPTMENVKRRASGPFIENSDSDDDDEPFSAATIEGNDNTGQSIASNGSEANVKNTVNNSENELSEFPNNTLEQKPALTKQESTSILEEDGFDGPEGFIDEEYADGEEFVERRWMQEQRRLEMAENGLDDDYLNELEMEDYIETQQGPSGVSADAHPGANSAVSCPMCSANLEGVLDAEVQLHVNNCLDGNPTPLPQTKIKEESDVKRPLTPNRFQRTPKPAKPGQANPFAIGQVNPTSGSAFSKIMSSHAEDAAWANAAAGENAARGKPAYERTCPFYKILPQFNICVDAFRYGAIQGCQAYFLSHFHSDHYVGLTSTWQHGPIYCSRVTGNLVRQQLRVDPKYVVDMEFEQKQEVPGTNGVAVTMISANHCPGSSLFLYEKIVGKGKNPKVHRVLHCGDFRACPAHLSHPLLRPELLDAVTNKPAGQQKIDVCYLDTTYLNPRYAFPSQEQVITACADMCVSLRKERTDENDSWEKMKRERAGSGMTAFVQKDVAKASDTDTASASTASTTNPTSKPRGRLLVVVGTYSIGKERICLGIARALSSKIYAPPNKQRICACLEDAELNSLLTTDPLAAQVHMTPLFEIRADTLQDYLNAYKPHFSRIVGFRPSGWNYRPPGSRFVEAPAVQTVLHGANWRSTYSMRDLVPQRGSTREANCFGVPYSEHSSFRELTMFCCALRIEKVIPTVNVGSAKGRERMKGWFEKWAVEKRKNGLFRLGEGEGEGEW